MSNFLIEQFPDAIDVDGEELAVNADFRVGLEIMNDFENPEFDQDEKAYLMLKRLYVDLPEGRDADFYQTAMQKAIKFLNAGEESASSTEGKPRLYSFSQDAKLIYAAFSQTHGIDLQTSDMHFWRFMALFMDLGADTAFCSLCNMRSRWHDGKLTDEEKKVADGMGEAFYLTNVEQEPLDEDEVQFIALLPEEDRKRFMEARKR